jgi:hypothetical protein
MTVFVWLMLFSKFYLNMLVWLLDFTPTQKHLRDRRSLLSGLVLCFLREPTMFSGLNVSRNI